MNNKKNFQKVNIKSFLFYFLFALSITSIAQTYPQDVTISKLSYTAPSSVPNYLETFKGAYFGNNITRISDQSVFDSSAEQLRHHYSKDQPWNSDGSLIKFGGYPAAILDGKTYKVLFWQNLLQENRWSHSEPDIVYGISGGWFAKQNARTGDTQKIHDFSSYDKVYLGLYEANLSNDDRYAPIVATKNGDYYLIILDVKNNQVTGTLNVGSTEPDWFSMSQSGDYAVVSWYDENNSSTGGIKVYDNQLKNERQLSSGTPHGDIGVDANGNDVYVGYYGNLTMYQLSNGKETVVLNESLWGGHISCRNVNRPGWAYVSDQGDPNNPDRYVAYREVFAVKLDGSNTVEEFAKHNTITTNGYTHQAQTVPNRDGSIMMFASDWTKLSNATSWVVEAPQNGNNNPPALTVNAGKNQTICDGNSVTLTATGANNYAWNTGETTASITVSPSATTTYTVTTTDGSNSANDNVKVTVNPTPVANAGNDVSINSGDSTTLTANGGDTYSWSTGETSQNITVSPSSTTTYSVTATSNGCSSSDDVVVTVNALLSVNAGKNQTICDGNNVTLTATGANNYAWNTGETTASITVSPSTTTTYTVTTTEGSNSVSDNVKVTVNPTPIANAGNDVAIISGESTTLTASGGDTYSWSTGETTQSITVSPSSTTTYSVTATSNGCSSSDKIVVTVNNAISINAGADQTICAGQNVTLTATGANNVSWNTGENTPSISVNPTKTTTYTVTATDGKSTATDEVKVIVNNASNANAGADVTICKNSSTILTATGGNSYLWSTGDTTASITVSPTSTTTYTVTADPDGCSSTDKVVVSVENGPVVNAGKDVSICPGESTTLTVTGDGNITWSTGEHSSSIIVNPSTTTTYTVTLEKNGCTTTDEVTVNVDACLGIDFSVFPNPTSGVINIHLTSLNGPLEISLINLEGKLLYSENLPGNQGGGEIVKQLDLSQYAKGIYLLEFYHNNKVHTEKIVLD